LALKLPEVPLAEKYYLSPTKVRKFPVDLYWCHDCNHVQQLDVVHPWIVWENYIFNPMKKMRDHFEAFASTFTSIPGFVIDIGSNDGSLLAQFKTRGAKVLGVDAAEQIAQAATDSGIETIGDLLDEKVAKEIVSRHGQADLVTAFNVFAHNDDLSGMLESIKILLKQNGKFCFECQYLVDILDKTLFPTIFHEHLSHHSVTSLQAFFKRHGMVLQHVERNNIQHGSIIGTVGFEGEADKTVTGLLALESSITIDSVRQFGKRIVKGKDFYECGYGAAHSGPTIQALLGFEVKYIVDDHPQKCGKWYGETRIISTENLLRWMPTETFILAWVHQKRIIENNQEYIRRGGRFYTSVFDPQDQL
jgi:SAM-dependent methyltransferase